MESESDTHLCLVCQETIEGLMEYVRHKRKGCQKKEVVSPGLGQVYSQNASHSQTAVLTSTLPPTSHTASYGFAGQTEFTLHSYSQSQYNGQGGYQAQSSSHSAIDHAYTAVQRNTDQESGLNVDVSSPLSNFIDSAFSPNDDSSVDPNSVLEGVGSPQSRPDFFHSLELERKVGEKAPDTGGKAMKSKRKGLPEEFDVDLPITMILSNLDFSSDEETGVMAFPSDGSELETSDVDWIEPCPPTSHTGGKWKPGQGPAKHYHPHRPTGGKWKPGQSMAPKKYKKTKRSFLKHTKSFYCNTCKMTFTDSLEYTTHTETRDHKLAVDMEKNGKSVQQQQDPPVKPMPSLVLDPSTGEMAEMLVHQSPSKLANSHVSVKRRQTKVAMCTTCDLYFDSVKVYDTHCETKEHKDSVARKTQELQEYMLGSTDSLPASQPQDTNGTDDPIKTESIKSEPESHTCVICDKAFARKYEMARHLLTQFHRQRARKHPKALEMLTLYNKYVIRLCAYQCNVCQFYCNRPGDLLDHLQSQHHMDNCQHLVGPLLCVTCKYKTPTAQQLLDHVKSEAHKESVAENHYVCIIRECHSKITCKYCGIQMHSAVRMRRHIEYRHSDRKVVQIQTKEAPLFPCPQCSKVMNTQYDLMKHFHRCHTSSRPFACDICKRSFVEQRDLEVHNESSMHQRRVAQAQRKKHTLTEAEVTGEVVVMEDAPVQDLKPDVPEAPMSEESPAKTPKKRGRKRKADKIQQVPKPYTGKKRGRKRKADMVPVVDDDKDKKETARSVQDSPSVSATGRPRRCTQRPRRYYSGHSDAENDSDSTLVEGGDRVDQAVTQAIETVLEMEKKAESGAAANTTENDLPEIQGVDISGNNALEEVLEAIESDAKGEVKSDGESLHMEVEEVSDDEDNLEDDDDMDVPDLDDTLIEGHSDAKKLNIFSCKYCDFAGGDMKELRTHSEEKHPKRITRCEPCAQIFLSTKSYRIHCAGSYHQKNLNKRGVKEELYVCPHCNRKTSDYMMHQLHIELVHLHVSTEEGVARTCQGRDMVSQLYGEHLKKLENVSFRTSIACPECGRFILKNHLIEHLRFHTGERPYKCRHCSKAFSAANSLRRHLLDHVGFKPIPCEECGKTFRKQCSYVLHMTIHENQKKGVKFPCEVCGTTFYAEKMLVCHMKRHGERRFKCEVEGCHLSFVLKGELDEHMCTHTKEKKFLCDICGLAGTKNAIRRHAKTHQPVKEIPCEYCPYKSSCKTHLKRHMRIHIGIKPFKCLYCSYACNTHENMRKHILQTRKHQGLKIYPCRFCSFQTNVGKEFKQHLHQFHMDYVKQRGSESLAMFSGLYRRDEDISEPPEGSEIHQVTKGRFVKVYDGTRIGKTGEAVGPAKKKSKAVKEEDDTQQQSESESTQEPAEPVQQPPKSVLGESAPESDQLQQQPEPVLPEPEDSKPTVQVHVAVASDSSQVDSDKTAASSVQVYPCGLPWTVVASDSGTEPWAPQQPQVVDMVLPQPYQVHNLQVLRDSGRQQGGSSLLQPSSVLTTINLDSLGSSYSSLEPGTYHVITQASDPAPSVSMVSP